MARAAIARRRTSIGISALSRGHYGLRSCALARTVALPLLLALALLYAPLASSQEKFKARNFRVRVAVQHEVTGLVLQPSGGYQILDASLKPVGQLRAGKPYFVQITRGRPAGLVWRIVIAEMDPHQVNAAIEMARKAKEKYNQPVKVIRYPARANEEERILVTMGEFNSTEAARNFARGLSGETVQHIYEERARATQGEVRLLDGDGVKLAQDSRFLRLAPLDLSTNVVAVLPLTGNSWSPAALGKARSYRGDMELDMNEEGTLTAVNDLWVEYYLYSVVAAEIGDDAPVEALKAQAVASRSEAVAKITRGITPSSFFDFYDNAMAQVYKGSGSESARVRAAVDATRGQMLVYGGEPVDAVYSHSCGGIVASSKEIWNGDDDPYEVAEIDRLINNKLPNMADFDTALRITSEPMDSLCNPSQPGFPHYMRDTYRWTKSLTVSQLTNIFDKGYGTGRVTDVIIDQRVPSGRVRRIRIVGTDKSVTLTREMEIRNTFNDLNSNFFTITKERGEGGGVARITIHGAGFGHGVGMCQMGAYMMAVQKYNYRQILAHYYQGVMIRVLYR